jgi:hypothetical protein
LLHQNAEERDHRCIVTGFRVFVSPFLPSGSGGWFSDAFMRAW